GAGTDVENPPHAGRIDPRGKAPLDELRDRRARDEHPPVDVKRQSGEPRLAREVYRGNALLDAAGDERVRALDAAAVDTLLISDAIAVVRQTQSVQHESRGLIAGIVFPVPEEDTRSAQPPRSLLDEREKAQSAPPGAPLRLRHSPARLGPPAGKTAARRRSRAAGCRGVGYSAHDCSALLDPRRPRRPLRRARRLS